MIYNSIFIEGDQETIDNIEASISSEKTLLEDLFPMAKHTTSVTIWKRANWGITEIKDMYFNQHHCSGKIVKAAIMIGFEADSKALKWVEHVSNKFKNATFELEVDENEASQYRSLAKFKNGERLSNQLTLF